MLKLCKLYKNTQNNTVKMTVKQYLKSKKEYAMIRTQENNRLQKQTLRDIDENNESKENNEKEENEAEK